MPLLPGREVVWTILAQKVREGQLRWLAETASIGAQLKLEGLRRTGRAPSPLMAALVVTENCNLRCPMCELPARFRRRPSQVDTDTWKRVIDQLAELGAVGVSLTGGEPTLRDDIFELLAHARGHGMSVAINTNALPLHGPRLEQFLDCPPDNVNVSIDSGDPELNDRLRGGRNVLARTVERIQTLIRERERRGLKFKLTVVSVLSDASLPHLDRLFAVVAESGADRIGFMPVHEVGDGVLQVVRVATDTSNIHTRLRALSDAHQLPLENSAAYLGGFHAQMNGRTQAIPACNAGYTSLIVGPDLRLYRCWPYFEKQQPLRQFDVDASRLTRIWNDPTYRADRLAALECSECYWNCHWELNHFIKM